MGDPGDRRLGSPEGLGARAEHKIRRHPNSDEYQRAPLAQQFGQARGGRVRSGAGQRGAIFAWAAQSRPRLKDEPGGRRHQPGIGSRGPDQRAEIHRRGGPMRERSGHRGRREKQEKPNRAEPASNRRPERDEPDAVHADMGPRAVQQGVSEQRPDLGSAAEDVEVPDQHRLFERGLTFVDLREHLAQPARPERDRQPARYESPIAGTRRLAPERRNRSARHGSPTRSRRERPPPPESRKAARAPASRRSIRNLSSEGPSIVEGAGEPTQAHWLHASEENGYRRAKGRA